MKLDANPRKLLLPLVPLYRLALAARELRMGTRLEPVRRLRFPVVSIGNLSTGGAGKTPLAIALARALQQRGLAVDVLSRGYRRRGQSAARVDPNGSADDFGDEPLLIAQAASVPVYVAARRYEAGLLAESAWSRSGPETAASFPCVHLLDDGFQHRQLYRDVDVLLLNRANWTDRLLPAGNLREPRAAFRRASVLAISADEPELEAELKAWGWSGPVWRLRRVMVLPELNGPVVAFCGIARPAQFFAGLEAAGARIAFRRAFRDHHRYTTADVQDLAAAAHAAGATVLLTTEKDRVRMGEPGALFTESLPLLAVPLRTEIENDGAVLDWLVARLRGAS